jgi:hypothetical protein
MTTEQKIVAEARRYARIQQAKIETQREFIRQLESRGGDAQLVRLEKDTLGAMMKSLDTVLRHLRPIIDRGC